VKSNYAVIIKTVFLHYYRLTVIVTMHTHPPLGGVCSVHGYLYACGVISAELLPKGGVLWA
jgi:hypothetical protein